MSDPASQTKREIGQYQAPMKPSLGAASQMQAAQKVPEIVDLLSDGEM